MADNRNPALERLSSFVGEWDLEISSVRSFQNNPVAVIRGHASFQWLEGGAFLLERSEVSNPDFPRATAMIGPDADAETYCMLYFDSRNVSRIYNMTMTGTTWTLWREFPGFSQRFSGMFSEDNNVITGRWEMSSDGSTWELDFNITYTRVH